MLQVVEDLRMTFSLGKKQILKCLLHIKREFNNSEPYHVLNDLYITDYCVWIQAVSHNALQSLSEQISNCAISKESVQLGLEQLEAIDSISDKLTLPVSECSSYDSDDSSYGSNDSSYDLSESERFNPTLQAADFNMRERKLVQVLETDLEKLSVQESK